MLYENGATRMIGVGFDITDRKTQAQDLEERVKELEAIRRIVELIEGNDRPISTLLAEVGWFLPESFQYPDLTEVRVTYGTEETVTDDFDATEKRIHAKTDTTDGHELCVEVGLRPADTASPLEFIPQEQELIDTIVSFLREYIDREEQLAKLQTAEQRYETILTHLSDYVMIIDGNAHIDYISPAVENVAGYTPAEIVGTSAFEYVYEEDQVRAAKAFAETLNKPQDEVTVEFRSTTADGGVHWIEARGSNYLDEPLIDGMLIAVRDISDRKEREAALRRERDRLNEFASVVSHDLRNPLNIAQGRVELAQETGDLDHLADIEQAHMRMHTLIEDLLTLARQGTEIGDTTDVDLRTMAEGCWSNVATAEAKLRVDAEVTITADEGRLRQLLENLFRNAVEHAGPDVTVTVGSVNDGFYLEDDGPGIPEEQRESIFELGFSTNDAGTGFGLSIVKQIAEAHGWEVQVSKGETGGARFSFIGDM